MELGQLTAKFFKNLEEYLIAVLMAAMLILIIAQIVLRFAQIPMAGIVETSTLIFTWIVFIGAAIGHRKGHKISVDMIVRLFPTELQRRIEIGVEVLTLLFLTVVGVVGIQLVAFQRIFTTPALELPVSVFAAALPISLGLMAADVLSSLLKTYAGGRRKC